MAKGLIGLLLILRGSGEASGNTVEGCLRLSRPRGLIAVEATPVARQRSCAKRMAADRMKAGKRGTDDNANNSTTITVVKACPLKKTKVMSKR